MFGEGLGVPRDDAKAAFWYRKAAEHSLPDAQIQLGTMIGAVQGVPRDFTEAYMWLELAATQGPAPAAQKQEILSWAMKGEQISNVKGLARD